MLVLSCASGDIDRGALLHADIALWNLFSSSLIESPLVNLDCAASFDLGESSICPSLSLS